MSEPDHVTPDDTEPSEPESAEAKAIGALAVRNIGPAFMGGRIADIAVHPSRRRTWYVAAGSGGVWKTTNAGTTWTPVFDDQNSYSIGCLAIDPGNTDVVWVGTGESVSGRHVAWGDGVYRSRNGGATWEHLGLEHSEHVGAILVDPRDGDTVLVAAEGPLWSSGGQRGVYRTTDGGVSWAPVLEIDDDTGVTSMVRAPDNPDVVYAAAYQRRRHVALFLGGGPGSGIHKSVDGGLTWRRVTEGLPKEDMGKIGLAVTPAEPGLVYATVEANEKERGFYRSSDRGESWTKRNDYISGGTGPHYYQEIFASPVDPLRVYQVDVFLQVTRDGGKTFDNLETGTNKHSDDHVVWIDPDDGDHLLIGTDAGLYESFDDGATFRHFPNLPLSQFYRVAADNSEPFYNVMGGAQDLGTLFGPSRTTNVDGVRNQDWSVPLGADGYHVAFDPADPPTSYLEWQIGNVMRHDRRTMELTDIQPQPGPDDPPERWNWDCPIVISPHDSNRIYVASQRVWRSDDRGDNWTPISGDLTTARNRYEIPTFGTVASVDSLYDHMAMSQFSTITHVCESSVAEGVLYAGTDDGLVHVTEDGGAGWRLTARPPDLPAEAFINDVEAGHHDGDVVFLAADDHKHGDYRPYLYRSTDRGLSWQSISGDLPDRTIIWAVEQDHINPDLLFVAAEFGIHVSLNGGVNWHRLSKDVPTISFRDIKLQRRDGDLVGASFGRGFFILDDYSPLRTLSAETLAEEAALFPVRDAWWYVPHLRAQAAGQPTFGSSAFRSPNPPFGATFTYHLSQSVLGPKKQRHEAEKVEREADADVSFPGLDALWEEHVSADPAVVLLIKDEAGRTVRRLTAEHEAGLHRTTWDLRHPAPQPIRLDKPEFLAPWERDPEGPLAAPGRYSVELAVASADGLRTLAEPQSFMVKPVPDLEDRERGAMEDAVSVPVDSEAFRDRTAGLLRQLTGTEKHVDATRDRIRHLRASVMQAADADAALLTRLEELHRSLEQIRRELTADPVLEKLEEPHSPSVSDLVGRAAYFHWKTTQPPTGTQVDAVDRAELAYSPLRDRFDAVLDGLALLTDDLEAAGGTWTPR